MKMIPTPTPADMTEYTGHVHNCLRNSACEPSYLAPLPAIGNLQLYVDFGIFQPVMTEFHIVNHCDNGSEQIFPSNYVIGQTPEGGWYGVFKYFNSPLSSINAFVVWLSATNEGMQTRTFFSELISIETCLPLTKIKACQPELATTTGFDINGLYYGLPQGSFLGVGTVRYFHIAWVRLAKVREMSNKGTFKSSLSRNFRTTIEKIHQLETELVPKWYKDVLLGIYARGVIQVNDLITYLVSDLNFEAINDDDLIWKPFVQLKETFRGFFGCDVSECMECCSPTVTDVDVHSPQDSESASDESGSESPSEEGYFIISYTNNENITVNLRIHNNGVGPLDPVYFGLYDSDPVIGTSPNLPAVNATIVFVCGNSKTFSFVSCNGIANPAAVGTNIAQWVGVNGPVIINFITN